MDTTILKTHHAIRIYTAVLTARRWSHPRRRLERQTSKVEFVQFVPCSRNSYKI